MKKLFLLLISVTFVSLGFSQGITTDAATNVTQTTATLNGTSNPVGHPNDLHYSIEFEYGLTTAYGSTATATPNSNTTNGTAVTADITGLTAGTTYHYRAKATYIGGTDYGSDATFTTSAATVPSVTIGAQVDTITKTTAEVHSNNATSDGGAAISDKGICWNTSGAPTTSDYSYSTGTSGTGTFNGVLTSLTAGTTYYVRAWATNTVGTGYSSTTRVFITDTDDPATTSATSVDESSFIAHWGSVTGAQGYYLDVSTASDFSSFVSGYQRKDVGSVTASTVSGLSANTTYYYRVRSYHNGGADGADFRSGYSNTTSVNTLVSPPSTQASNLKWETVNSGADMHLTWTRGNGAGCIVVMKAGSAVTNPSDGTTYTANSAFGSGSDVGNLTYVVYIGTGTEVTVTGLSSGTTYYFKVMEYNDGAAKGNLINYNTTGTDGWTGSQGNSQLPIELTSFTANHTGEGIELAWNTASEINNQYFELQRSADGNEFEVITRIKGAGSTNIPRAYQFVDKEKLSGVIYYRLKQVDYDGTSTLSKVIFVEMSNHPGLGISKVAQSDNKIEIYLTAQSANAVVSLYNLQGQLMNVKTTKTDNPSVIHMDMNGMAHGIYMIVLDNGNEKITRKVQF